MNNCEVRKRKEIPENSHLAAFRIHFEGRGQQKYKADDKTNGAAGGRRGERDAPYFLIPARRMYHADSKRPTGRPDVSSNAPFMLPFWSYELERVNTKTEWQMRRQKKHRERHTRTGRLIDSDRKTVTLWRQTPRILCQKSMSGEEMLNCSVTLT